MSPDGPKTVKAGVAAGPVVLENPHHQDTPLGRTMQATLPVVLGVLAAAAWWLALAAVAVAMGGLR